MRKGPVPAKLRDRDYYEMIAEDYMRKHVSVMGVTYLDVASMKYYKFNRDDVGLDYSGISVTRVESKHE